MNVIREIQRINELELEQNISASGSWHDQYKDSAYIYVGGLASQLTEGDLICIFSQYGEIVDVNLVRDKSTGESKGFAFIAYEDQRSTVLAVDNFTGAKVAGRTLRVDHVKDYKKPQRRESDPEPTEQELMDEKIRRNNILPPHLRDSDFENSDHETEPELPPEIAALDPEDPLRELKIKKWKKKLKKKKK